MNKKPVSYLQTDSRWSAKRYPCNGGTMSVGGGGCGPTAAAMLAETMTGKTCLPPDALEWACKHGYVTSGHGTDYAFFKPFLNQYNIECEMLTWTECRSATSPIRQKVIDKLKDGYYFIALMRAKYIDPVDSSKNIPGTWTKGGHYVVVWWADNKIRINDPASTKDKRVNGDPDTFFAEAKYFWWVDARAFNNGKDDLDMTKKEFLASLTDDEAFEILQKAKRGAAKLPPSDYARAACQRGIESGLFKDGDGDGLVDNPRAPVERQELATVLDRKGLLKID